MSQLPQTTRRAVVAAAVVGVAGLALHEPLLVVAALAGLAVGLGVRGLSGSPSTVIVAAGLMPLGLVAAVATVGTVAAEPTVDETVYSTLAALSVLLMGVVGPVLGGSSPTALRDASWGALAGAATGTVLATLASILETHGQPPVESVVYATGGGFDGIAATVAVTAVAGAGAVVAVPDAAVTTPRRKEFLPRYRRQAIVAIVALAGVLLAVVAAARVVVGRWLVSQVFDTLVFRGLLVGLAVLCLLVAATGLLVGFAWNRGDKNGSVAPLLLGTVLSLTVIVGGGYLAGIPPASLFAIPLLLGVAGVSLMAFSRLLELAGGGRLSGATPVALTALCLAGVAAVGADIGKTATPGPSLVGVVSTLGAGLFIYVVGTNGATLHAHVGSEGATREPQLVRIAYAVSVVAVSAAVTVGGIWLAMAVAPTLSVPSTLALVSALVATGLVLRTLLR